MYKLFAKIFLLATALVVCGMKANAEYWQPANNHIGNMIYVDKDSIRQKDNQIFYVAKYFEDDIKGYSKLLIMSDSKHPFVIGDPVAFKNSYFMINLKFVNDKVLNYVNNNYIQPVEPGSDYDSISFYESPYAKSVIAKIKSNLKYKFAFRNSSAKVMIKINKQGELKKVYIYESSGNQKLNIALTEAIEASSPFTPLPEEYNKTFAIMWLDVSYGKSKSVIFMNSVVSLGKTLLK